MNTAMRETSNSTESPKFSVLAEEFADMLIRRGGVTKDADGLRALAADVMSHYEQGHAAMDVLQDKDLLEGHLKDWSTVVGLEENEDWARPVHPLAWNRGTGLLYLSRCRQAEHRIGAFVSACLANNRVDDFPEPGEEAIRGLTRKLSSEKSQEQRDAVKKCSGKRLAVLTGGPGTGKTTTLGAILLLELQRNPGLSISLCAPTGKAAAQMRKALQEELKDVEASAARDRLLSLQPRTIQKLLGISFLRNGLPRYHHATPLPCRLVVVDESSMVDLVTFSRLVDALPEDGRLLLLGDKDQLDAVETGVVFSDLVKFLEEKHSDCLQKLRTNFRSEEIRALVEFAHYLADREPGIQDSRREAMLDRLFNAADDAPFRAIPPRMGDEKAILAELAAWVRRLNLEAPLPKEGESPEVHALAWLEFHEKFKVLCATRGGLLGVGNMNQRMKKLLGQEHGGNGVPLMNTRNDSVLGIQNGDIGVRLGDRVYFRNHSGSPETNAVKSFPCAQLLEQCEEAYAITVHKSQGSSYDHILVTLPDNPDNPLLTKNLLYTAITRARKSCLVWAPRKSVEKAVETITQRISGLAREWGSAQP